MYYNETTAEVDFEDKKESYDIWFLEFEGFTCAYALFKKRKKNEY